MGESKRALRPLRFVLFAVAILIAGGCGGPHSRSDEAGQKGPERLLVSAAASLADAATQLATAFQEHNPGVQVQVNFGSSGALRQQIENGAPVDVLIAASAADMAALIQSSHIAQDDVRIIARNTLTLIAPKDAPSETESGWASLISPAVKRIAIGNPDHVPAGRYAKQVLEWSDAWEAVRTKLVYAEDVRQALRFVESGAVDAGVVYHTDAVRSSHIRLLAPAPLGSHDEIVYPAAVTAPRARSRRRELAARFLDFVSGPDGVAILAHYGFEPAPTR